MRCIVLRRGILRSNRLLCNRRRRGVLRRNGLLCNGRWSDRRRIVLRRDRLLCNRRRSNRRRGVLRSNGLLCNRCGCSGRGRRRSHRAIRFGFRLICGNFIPAFFAEQRTVRKTASAFFTKHIQYHSFRSKNKQYYGCEKTAIILLYHTLCRFWCASLHYLQINSTAFSKSILCFTA